VHSPTALSELKPRISTEIIIQIEKKFVFPLVGAITRTVHSLQPFHAAVSLNIFFSLYPVLYGSATSDRIRSKIE
jgi:hypothetical protein